MVNYHDPKTVAQDFELRVKLWHFVDGLFIWEFFTTLDFEWDAIRGRRPWRWTIWVYSVTRVATLMTIILNIISFNATTRIDCQAWATLIVTLPSIVFGSASLLIMFRIIAIWNTERTVIIVAMCIWLIDAAFLIDGSARLRSSWSSEAGTCVLLNAAQSTTQNVISSLVTDILLLFIMLIGLFRMRIEAGSAIGLARVLWRQGLIWLLIATAAEVPSTVLMFLNLNDPLSYLFQAPNMVTMAIASTRMYRSLVTYDPSEFARDLNNKNRLSISTMHARPGPIPLTQMMSVRRTDTNHYPMSQISGCDSYITDQDGLDKAHDVSLNVDVENGRDK